MATAPTKMTVELSAYDRRLIRKLIAVIDGTNVKELTITDRLTEPATDPEPTTEADEAPEQAPERITEPATDALHPAIGYRPRGTR